MTTQALPEGMDILKEAWLLLQKKWVAFLGILLVPALVSIIASRFFEGNISTTAPIFLKSLAGDAPLSSIWPFLAFLLISILQTLASIALVFNLHDSVGNAGALESYKKASQKIFSYWWVAILVGLITSAGLALLVIPALFFWLWFSMAKLIVITEDRKGMAALLRSKAYVEERLGAVLYRLFFITVILILLAWGLGAILLAMKAPYSNELGILISGLILNPLSVAYTYLLYRHLRQGIDDANSSEDVKKRQIYFGFAILGLVASIAVVVGVTYFGWNSDILSWLEIAFEG